MIKTVLHSLRSHKLSQDIAYSMSSFTVLALSGIVINIVVTAFRDAAALGIFNIAYAIYIMASQFAVWGLHYSVLRHSSYFELDLEECSKLLTTACLCALASGVVFASVFILSEPLFANIFHDDSIAISVKIASSGLLLFPLNKVLLAYLNGLRRMRAFSVLQAVRYIVITMFVCIVVAAPAQPIEKASWCFVVAEALTTILALTYIMKRKLVSKPRFAREWVSKHYAFGTKALMAGIFTEINARIDVLLIGFFLTPYATGIYSFAAMLVDGLYQILSMVRTNFNPILVSALRDRQWIVAQNLRLQARKYILPVAAILSFGLVAAYYVFAAYILPDKGLLVGFPALLILLSGLLGVSFLVPFDNLMLVSGHPGYQTVQQVAAVAANIFLSVILLPYLGINGAALGTAASYGTGIAMLIVFSRKLLGWSLISNKMKA